MMKKKILFAANRMNIGGIEKSLLSLLHALGPDKYDIHLALMSDGGGFRHLVPPYVTVHYMPALQQFSDLIASKTGYVMRNIRSGKFMHACRAMYGFLAGKLKGSHNDLISAFIKRDRELDILDTEYDLAICYPGPSELFDCLVAQHVKAKKKAMWIHFDIDHVYHNRRSAMATHAAYDKIFCVSKDSLDVYRRCYPAFADRADTFYNIVDRSEIISCAAEASRFRKASAPTVNLVTVGRLHPAKGFDIALEAAGILKQRGFRFLWHIVGAGELETQLRTMCADAGLDDCVRFYGGDENPYPYMRGADVYVQPSRHEGYCITLAEAKIFGMPIVATDFSGAVEQLSSRSNALICKADARAVAGAIVKASEMPRVAVDGDDSNDLPKLLELL